MAQVMSVIKDLAGSVDEFIKSVNVDDSQVPYLELVLGFMALEYVFHTYLDLRQRKVCMPLWPTCGGSDCMLLQSTVVLCLT